MRDKLSLSICDERCAIRIINILRQYSFHLKVTLSNRLKIRWWVCYFGHLWKVEFGRFEGIYMCIVYFVYWGKVVTFLTCLPEGGLEHLSGFPYLVCYWLKRDRVKWNLRRLLEDKRFICVWRYWECFWLLRGCYVLGITNIVDRPYSILLYCLKRCWRLYFRCLYFSIRHNYFFWMDYFIWVLLEYFKIFLTDLLLSDVLING